MISNVTVNIILYWPYEEDWNIFLRSNKDIFGFQCDTFGYTCVSVLDTFCKSKRIASTEYRIMAFPDRKYSVRINMKCCFQNRKVNFRTHNEIVSTHIRYPSTTHTNVQHKIRLSTQTFLHPLGIFTLKKSDHS